ncbi:hypothetical protein GC722_11390 [Auraticoccus sp. F435]|uniref:Beta-hexosaminidase bacterial type N-terminal domain-containing protein n=1 Tax=Auraticoccus cholistanensis TaxID=2656650 RepID=A0A6A9UY02_9ACTN|nr:hypothetical protein [Auraticoccus cholistanensis]
MVTVAGGTTTPRLDHGLALVTAALGDTGATVHPPGAELPAAGGFRLLVGVRSEAAVQELERQEVLLYTTGAPGPNGFYLAMLPGGVCVVTGGDEVGVLYGCQELARLVRRTGGVPRDLDHGETPDLVLRGPAVGLQKTTVEPRRQTYEYPVTPDRFPWFYDRALWTDVLDELFEQRANVVYLWSGHPFSSFVRLAGYPEAQEVTDEELRLNRETLSWLTEEAARRGIWVVLHFYNIHIPLPFAEHHQIPLHQPRPTPLTAAYTRAAVAAFVTEYPDVGLYVCLGEALQGDLHGQEWFLETILPAVREGVRAAGGTDWPPLILRGHAIDPQPIVDAARALHPRLYTEAKYNGESLTTWNPRGDWQRQHQYLASLGSTHIANVHILANLEPFRYGAVSFIRRSVQAMKHRLHVQGLHLYPLFYWDWPWSPDRAEPRLRQLDRDWLWYAAWLRYAWKADRDPDAEESHWTRVLAERFGSEPAGRSALAAYEAMGQVAPRLVRRVGITEGNRQTLSLGMTMSQLVNPHRHRPWPDLWNSHAPFGERLDSYVRRELAGAGHVGETPLDVVDEVRHFSRLAVSAVERGSGSVHRHRDEYERLRTDAVALAHVAEFYALRILAAVEVLSYREAPAAGDGPARLRRAVELVAESVERYRELAELTARTYSHANSMRTPQRKVPFRDGHEYGHWTQCLPRYEEELTHLRRNVARLTGSGRRPAAAEEEQPFRWVPYRVLGEPAEEFVLTPGERLLRDLPHVVTRLAPELEGSTAHRISHAGAAAQQVLLEVELAEPGHLLVGYFRDPSPQWLQVPDLEVDTHADARGGLEPVLRHAVEAEGLPSVDVHAHRLGAGRHTLALGRGAYVVLGAVRADQRFSGRDTHGDGPDDLDWLFCGDDEGGRR